MSGRIVDLSISIRDLFLAAVVVIVLAPLWFLPWRASCWLARRYGLVAFLFWGKGRRAGMINLRRAYGTSMSRHDARRSIATVFSNLAQSMAEAMQFVRRFGRGDRWRTIYRLEDRELAQRILDDPRPKVFATGHLGSWEVAILLLQRTLRSGAGIARRVDNRWLDRLVKAVRLEDPSQWIEKRGGAAEALRRLRKGESVVMLVDENGGRRGPFIDFFGRPASTRKTPALLSLLTGAPIVVGAAIRDESAPQPAFIYRLAFIDPAAEGLTPANGLIPVTARIQGILEAWIRETPLQWRWIHWRWRARSDGSDECYGRRDVDEAFGG
jgi:Kdo2-lipid IVA lauroyltransferase/acyltransferase